jgi:hypothetical protein
MMGAWGRKHCGQGRLLRLMDDGTGEDVQAVAIDARTGAEIGTRQLKVSLPDAEPL